jgi:Do/DeqQ family serine protease
MVRTIVRKLPIVVASACAFAIGACTSNIDRPNATQTQPAPVITSGHGLVITENTFADLAAEAMKSVVNIDTTTSVSVPSMGIELPFFFGDEPLMPHLQKYEMRGTGSGVIIKPDGYILTNNHVVGNAQQIKVTLNDKRVFTGHVVGRDSFTDLALVKIDANNLPTARLGSAKNLRPGDFALAIGSPAGLSNTVTLGIISALGRSLGENLGEVGLVQTDTAINPGNSGGPLLNIRGEVIGINTAIRKDYQNIGFAIPMDTAKQVADQLISHGAIKHAWVGIQMADLNDQINKQLRLPPGKRGVVVAQVVQGSPADDAGLTTGDVILNVDNKPVSTAKDVQQLVRKHKPGDQVPMTVERAGQSSTVNITIGEYPAQTQQQE